MPNEINHDEEEPAAEYTELTAPIPGASTATQQQHAKTEGPRLPVAGAAVPSDSGARFASVDTTSGSGDPGGRHDASDQEGINLLPVPCQWETRDAEWHMKDRLGTAHTILVQSIGGSLELDSISAGITARGPVVSAQASATVKMKKSEPYRQTDPARREMKYHLQHNSCLMLSLHTGVFQRVRLREVVAYFVDNGYVRGQMTTEEKSTILLFLRSNDLAAEWIDRVKKEIVNSLEDITKLVFEALRCSSGVVRRKHLYLHWPGEPELLLHITQKQLRWMKALKDLKSLTTFACVVNHCQETPECRCRMAQQQRNAQSEQDWTYPTSFRLRTTMKAYTYDASGLEVDLPPILDQTYFFKEPSLGLLCDIIGHETTPRAPSNAATEVFYVVVRKSALPGWIAKYFPKYHSLDERHRPGDNRIYVVGSGDDFERLEST